MGFDVKDVGIFIWKILRFSMNTTFRFARKYPIFSGVFLFLLILHIFLPSVFYFLLYSSPILVCLAVYFKILKTESSVRDKKKTEKGLASSVQTGSVSANSRNDKSDLRPQRSVRRNASRKVEEMGKDGDSQGSEDQKDNVILTALYNELLGRRTPNSEESERETVLLEAQERSFDHTSEGSFCNPDTVIDPFEKLTSGGGETEVESLEEEDDEQEEETQEDRNKAVEWTEDDQKNLMDLGISEIERNKRLESLIARRQARKLFLLAAEKSLMDMEIPPIFVGRNNIGYDFQNYYDNDELQMPGSAPSVLLPTRNPFDLPYDPQEEKPNLMGDSFHQEFAVANQKEMFFCRHESFCRSYFPSEHIQDSKLESYSNTEKKAIDGSGISRFRRQFETGDNDHPVEKEGPLSEENDPTEGTNPENSNNEHQESGNGNMEEVMGNSQDVESNSAHRSEVQIETDSIRNDDSDSSSSFSPRKSKNDFNVINQAEASGPSHQTNGIDKYPMGLGDHIRNSLTGLSVTKANVSSSLAKERQRYMEHFGYNTGKGHMVTHSMDSDLQVEVSEIGSPPTTVDGNDSSDDEKLSFVYESEIGNEMVFGSEETESKPTNGNENELISSKKPVETIASSETSQMQEGQYGLNDMGPSISPENEVPEAIEVESHFTKMVVKQVAEDSKGHGPSSNAFSLENSEKGVHMTEDPVILQPPEVNSLDVEESPEPVETKPADEIRISYDFDEPEQAEKIDPESSEHAEKIQEEPTEQVEMKEEKIQNSEEPTRENASNADQEQENAESSAQETRDEETIEEVVVVAEVSDVNHENSNEFASSSQQAGSSVGRVSPSPSRSSSPRSVLLNKLPLDQTYSLNSEDWERVDIPEYDIDNTVNQSYSSDFQPQAENADPGAHQTHSATHQSRDRDVKKLEESSGSPEKFTEDTVTAVSESSHEAQKPEEGNANSDVHRAMEKQEETIDSPRSLPEESRITDSINDIVIIEKIAEGSKPVEVTTSKITEEGAEEWKPIEHENVLDSSKQVVVEVEPETIRDVQGESKGFKDHSEAINPTTEEVETNKTETPGADRGGKSSISEAKDSESHGNH